MGFLIGLVYTVVLLSITGFLVWRFVPVVSGIGKRMAVVVGISVVTTIIAEQLGIYASGATSWDSWVHGVSLGTVCVYISKFSSSERHSQ